MTGPGWMERVFTFYDAEGAAALRMHSPGSTAAACL